MPLLCLLQHPPQGCGQAGGEAGAHGIRDPPRTEASRRTVRQRSQAGAWAGATRLRFWKVWKTAWSEQRGKQGGQAERVGRCDVWVKVKATPMGVPSGPAAHLCGGSSPRARRAAVCTWSPAKWHGWASRAMCGWLQSGGKVRWAASVLRNAQLQQRLLRLDCGRQG